MDSTQTFISQQIGPTISQDQSLVFQRFEEHDWEKDVEFQSGIGGILGPMKDGGASEQDLQSTKLRAQIFFYATKSGHSFTAEDYQQWKATQPPSTTTPSSSETTSDPPNQTDSKPSAPPHPASFDAIVELISTGRTDEIPGIKDIPLKINEAEPTTSTIQRPPKPWEQTPVSSSIEKEDQSAHNGSTTGTEA